jgi:hypothetical protein
MVGIFTKALGLSFLVHNNYVIVSTEGHKLAVLCLQYLIFECFDPYLSDERVRHFLMQGYFSRLCSDSLG